MATWIIKIGAEYVRYSGPLGVARTTTQRLAVRFATRAAARETVSEIAILQRPIGQGRIVRLRTREERTIDHIMIAVVDVENKVDRLSDRVSELELDLRSHNHDEDDY